VNQAEAKRILDAYNANGQNASALCDMLNCTPGTARRRVQIAKMVASGPAPVQDVAPAVQFPDQRKPINDFRDLLRHGADVRDFRDKSNPSQQYGTVDLSEHDGPIGIMTMSDVHIGSPQCDYYSLLRHIGYLADIPNLYAISQGDLVEGGIQQKHMDATLSQVFPPQMQMRAVQSMWKALLGKILAVIKGNHDNYDYRFSGVDLTEFLVESLGQRGLYMKDGGTLIIKMAGVEYSWRVKHGDMMPGNSMYSATAGMQRHARMNAGWHDIQSSGHTHTAEVTFSEQPRSDGRGMQPTLVMRSGTYKIFGDEEYSDRAGFAKPSQVLMPAVILFPREKRMIPFLRVEDCVEVLLSLNKAKKRAA
jgi:hypothetical protein